MTTAATPAPSDGELLDSPRGRRHLGLATIAQLALPISAAITGPIFARTIGAVGRGEVTAITAPIVLLTGLISGSLTPAVIYHLGGAHAPGRWLVRHASRLAVAIGAAATIAIWVAAPALLRSAPDQVTTMRLCALAIPALAVGRVWRAAATAHERFRWIAGAGVAAGLARTLGVVAFAVVDSLTVRIALLVVLGYEFARVVPFVARGVGWLGPDIAPSDPARVGAGVRSFARRSFLSSGANLVTLRLDVVILAPLVASDELGHYVFAFGLAQLWSGLLRAAPQVALPAVMRSGDHDAVRRLSRVSIGASVLVVLGAIALGDELVRIVYGDGFDDTARLLPWLLGAGSVFALEALPGSVLLSRGRAGTRAIGPTTAAIVTVVGLALLAPPFGIVGAAVVSVVAYLTAFTTTAVLAARTVGGSWLAFFVPVRSDSGGRPEAAPTPIRSVDVLVPTYRRPDQLAECLAAIEDQSRPPDRVVVAVRDSDDQTRAWLDDSDPGVDVVVVGEPGQVAALNALLDAARSDMVAIFDDDAVPDLDWLERAVAHFDDRPELGGVCGRDRLVGAAVVPGTTARPIGRVSWYGRLTGLFHRAPDGLHDVDHLKGCAMAYRRAAVGATRFDRRLRGSGAQYANDTAFSFAIAREGWALLCDTELEVDHRHGVRDDDASRPSHGDDAIWYDATYNEALVIFGHLDTWKRRAARVWLGGVGSRNRPGLVQIVRFLPTRRRMETFNRYRAGARARRDAWADAARS